MKPIIFPYKLGSKSASNLAKTLNTKKVRPNGNYKYFNSHLIVNLGSSVMPNWNRNGVKWLNRPDKVHISHNKLTALNKMKNAGVNTIEFTTDKNAALGWINNGNVVMCRTKLVSHSGHGIIVAETTDKLVNAPLYTRYVKGTEFRVHVIKNGNNYIIFDVQQKKKMTDFQGTIDNLIRSHHRGWVFCREGLEVPNFVKNEAIKAVQALELDFGAVDIKFNRHSNKAFVLEVNTSPGLEGQTLENYTNEILTLCNQNFA